MTIKNFKTIIIAASTTSTTFTIPIFLQFVPSYFIIRLVSYSITSAEIGSDAILLLKTSLLNNESILSLVRPGVLDSASLNLDLKFKMNPNFIGGNYDFTLCNIAGSPPDEFTSMQIALTIEFVEEI
jgi:hypothetical protein